MANLNLSFAMFTYGIFIFSLSLKLSMAGTVWLYGDNRFGELVYKSHLNTSSDCISFPDSAIGKTVYVITDTCIYLYKNKQCKQEPNRKLETTDGTLKSTKLTTGFNAFQPCNNSGNSDSSKLVDSETRQQNAQLNVTIFYAALEMAPEGNEFILEFFPETTIHNQGNGTITHDYKASRMFTEYLRIDRSYWYTDVTTVTTRFDMEFENPEFDAIGPFVDRLTFPSHIRKAFLKGTRHTVDSSQIYLFEQPHDFNIHELLQVPACTQYSIETSFQVDFMVFYLYLNMVVSGKDNEGNPIPATVLKDILPVGLSYQDSSNDYEVIAQSEHYVTTEYGTFLRANNNAYTIRGC